MQGAKLDLLIQRGSTFRRLFQLQQPDTTPVDLTGALIRGKIRKDFKSSVVVDLHAEIYEPVIGKCLIQLTATETEAISFATGVYDVEIEFSNGDVRQALFGNVLVRQEATY